jgi:YesN/AraC family two-component response regulator
MLELDKLRVLYAEDDDVTRNTLEPILAKFFGEVVAVEDGEKGVESFRTYFNDGNNIDIIVSDINMPKMNGLEMLKNIREIDTQIPAVLITAHSEADFLLEAINLNVSQYLVKPVKLNLLFEKLKTAYLPIHQKHQLEMKNLELEKLNQKIKEVAKQEIEKLKIGDKYMSDDDIDFGVFLDNITLDD